MNKITILQTLSKQIKKLGKDKTIFYAVVEVEPYSKSNFTKFSRGNAYVPERMLASDRIVAAECARIMGKYDISKYDGPLFMQIDGYFKNRRVFDAPNLSKSICDALSEVVYYDDRQIISCICTKTYDKENPRVEIYVSQYDGEHEMVNVKSLTEKEAGIAKDTAKLPAKKAAKPSRKAGVKIVKRAGRKVVKKANGTSKRTAKQKTK